MPKSRKSRKSSKSAKAPRKTARSRARVEEPAVAIPAGVSTPAPIKVAPVRVDPVQEVINKYNKSGWVAMRAPEGTLNDVLARKDKRFHFVQVLTKDNAADPKFTGLQRNNFVQNAFSNGADPVYAFLTVKSTRQGTAAKITFENVNLNRTVIIGGKRPAEPEPADKN